MHGHVRSVAFAASLLLVINSGPTPFNYVMLFVVFLVSFVAITILR